MRSSDWKSSLNDTDPSPSYAQAKFTGCRYNELFANTVTTNLQSPVLTFGLTGCRYNELFTGTVTTNS